DGKAELHAGNYSDLVRRRKEETSADMRRLQEQPPIVENGPNDPTMARVDVATVSSSSKKKEDRKREKAGQRAKERDEKRLSSLEGEITSLEVAIRDLEVRLSDPAVYRDGEKARTVQAEIDAARKSLEARIWEWEETGRKLEAAAR